MQHAEDLILIIIIIIIIVTIIIIIIIKTLKYKSLCTEIKRMWHRNVRLYQ